MQNGYFSLEEIASWQQEVNESEQPRVTLPSLQRGFVWRPHQMEALWDSILRGFPIGSILMASGGGQNKFLLDGQQRCTTIALGFNNPFSTSKKGREIFSLKEHLPSVWIDLKPGSNLAENYKYAVRVLNRSHPWGYQQRFNTKPLSMKDRQQALAYFKTKQPDTRPYTDLNPSTVNPWDAHFPVPLAFLLSIQAKDEHEFTDKLKNAVGFLSIKTKHSNNEKVDFDCLQHYDLKEIFEGIKKAQQLRLPEICVSEDALKEDNTNEPDSQDPTLFVRLNSAGTALTGEELIYSIFKAAYPKSKDLVESIGASYIAPRKIINIFSRLATAEKNGFSSFPTEYTIRTFRNALNDVDYKNRLEAYIEGAEHSEAEKLVKIGIQILSQKKDEFPAVITKQLIVSNIDLFLLLLIYIKKYGLHVDNALDDATIKDISGAYVHVLWFGRDKKIAGKLFDKLFKNASNPEMVRWRVAINQIIDNNPDLILRLLEPQKWRELLCELVVTHKIKHREYVNKAKETELYHKIRELVVSENHWENEALVKVNWDDFLGRIYWNKTMLLYAQREYINDKFYDYNQFENIEDTNRPWDWDHIYPISWVYNKNNIHELVRAWVNSVGNMRALSYDDNRSESNNESPQKRLSKETNRKKESFINDNDGKYWEQLDEQHTRIQENSKALDAYLKAIVNRTVNIYQEWYDNYYMGSE